MPNKGPIGSFGEAFEATFSGGSLSPAVLQFQRRTLEQRMLVWSFRSDRFAFAPLRPVVHQPR
eukprot:13029380-Alexandrium_andersonii.AAC.1